MAPTEEEITFARGQLERIARTRPDRAFRMQLYLDQGAGLQAQVRSQGDNEQGTQ